MTGVLLRFCFVFSFFSGPGQYDVKSADNPGGLITTRQQRFKLVKSDTPGPGSYEVCLTVTLGCESSKSFIFYFKVSRQR